MSIYYMTPTPYLHHISLDYAHLTRLIKLLRIDFHTPLWSRRSRVVIRRRPARCRSRNPRSNLFCISGCPVSRLEPPAPHLARSEGMLENVRSLGVRAQAVV
eukprot:1147022-Prorocentrum_minimum.AAC.1